jgi:hypothetical protein
VELTTGKEAGWRRRSWVPADGEGANRAWLKASPPIRPDACCGGSAGAAADPVAEADLLGDDGEEGRAGGEDDGEEERRAQGHPLPLRLSLVREEQGGNERIGIGISRPFDLR